MNNKAMVVFFSLLAATVLGQRPNDRGEMGPRASRSLNYGNWVGRRVLTKEVMEDVGITGAQAEKLKAELEKLEEEFSVLDEAINKAALEQAEVAKKVLEEKGAKLDEVFSIIEKIGKLRTEQAKLSTQMLVAIRDNLTDEQRKKVNELIASEAKRRMQERNVRREREDRAPNAPPNHNRPALPQGW